MLWTKLTMLETNIIIFPSKNYQTLIFFFPQKLRALREPMAAKSHVEDPVLAEMSYDVQFAFRAGQEDNNSYKAIL